MVTHLQISTNNTRRARREHRWKQLAPTVLWSILILVLTPSLRGFSLSGVYVGNRIGLARGMSFPRSDIRREVVASSEACSGAEVARRSPLAAESWLRRRFRAERRRIKMQVASWTQGAVDPEVVASGPIPSSERVFLIDGWRWHTRVAIRDSGRFRKVALFAAKKSTGMDETMDMDSRGMGRVVKSYQHMWDFSFAKLYMIETKLFFPWLRKLLPREVLPLLSQFEKEREDIIRIGRQIGTSLDEAVRNSEARRSPRAALLRCADLSSLLETKVSSLSRTQEDSIIPITSAHVSSKDQDRFNDKVIRSLGLLDAQVLLVAMHDTLKPDRQEYGLFRSQVPKVARALIPTWRRLLYRPRAGCLEESDELSVL